MSKAFKTMELLPFHEVNRTEIPVDGIYLKLPEFCCKKFLTSCKDFYRRIETVGFHRCPYGYAVRSFLQNGRMSFYVGLNVPEVVDRKKLKKGERFPEQSQSAELVNALVHQNSRYQTVRSDFGELRRDRQIYADTIHEVRNFNASIKAACESHNFDAGPILSEKAQAIVLNNLALSQMITSRLEYQIFLVNPSQAKKEKINFYKKVDKVVKSSVPEGKKKSVSIVFTGSSFSEIEGYPFVDQIPAVLVQNAVKYSVPNSIVKVDINESFQNIVLKVENTGPTIYEDEKLNIYSKGYRGKEGKKFTEGTGVGLWFLSKILKAHDASIDLKLSTLIEEEIQKISVITFEVKIPKPR